MNASDLSSLFKFMWLPHPTLCSHTQEHAHTPTEDLGVLCKWVQKSFNHRKAQWVFMKIMFFLISSSSLSCLARLSFCQSVRPAVSQTGHCTSGGEGTQCQISCNILKMQEFETVSPDCFADSSISGSCVQAPIQTILLYPFNTLQL